ncbi:MAG: NUDIX hydrolase [Anaerolineaceae bacterium]|nr:NUDIX hydrolase [Anaerolineaceae bacterium]
MGHHHYDEIKYCPYCGSPTHAKDVYGQSRAACPNCRWVHYEDPKVAAAVLVQQNGSVLLTRRIYNPNKGDWTLPAGFVDAHEDPMQAAARECQEETGLLVRITRLRDIISGREHERGADMVIVYDAEIIGGELSAGDDADQVAFFPLNQLPSLAFQATKKVIATLQNPQ